MFDPNQDGPIVDTHAHVFTLDLPRVPTSWHQPPADASIEDYIDTLDENGVNFGILAAASLFGDYNDYQLEAIRRHKRLRATVIVSPAIDRLALRDMNDAGVVGIRLQLRNVTDVPDLTSYEYRVLMRRIADLGWHVQLFDVADRLANFIPAIENAGPRIVLDHMARPETGKTIESDGFAQVLRAIERGRTWVKISGGFRVETESEAQVIVSKLLEHAGPQRLMWGSDWPFAAFEDRMTYRRVISDYRSYVPDVGMRRLIDRTALGFYFS